MADISQIQLRGGATYDIKDAVARAAIPSNLSDLTNDSGFISTETDPTVPAWAKASSKPTYTASEVGALPANTTIPSKTSDLTNDSGFVNTTGAAAAAPVQSVNGQTGAVTIDVSSGVAVQDNAPTGDELVWVDTDDDGAFHTIPEINDTSISSSDTWSSQKINTMFSSGTSNGWTYMRIGNNVFAWYFNQITAVNVNTQWVSGTYRSGELQAAPSPTFLKDGYSVSASLAKGSQSAGINLGRVLVENNAIRVYLTCTASYTNVNCAVMVYAFGEWNG